MERKKEQAASCTSISYNPHFFDTWKTDGHACIRCALTLQFKSLATTLTPWHLGSGYFLQCRCRISGQQSRILSAVGLVLIGSFQPSLLSSSYMPRPIFLLPSITPGPGTGQLETTLTAQSLLKLFKPYNPNPNSNLPTLPHAFLSGDTTAQALDHAHSPLHPQFVLPPDPPYASWWSCTVWFLLLETVSTKYFIQGSCLQVCHLHIPDQNTSLVHFNTCSSPFFSQKRSNLYSQGTLPTQGYTHPLKANGSHMCYPNINMPRASAGICLCPVMQSLQWGHCASKGRAVWCHVPAGALHLVPDAYRGNSIGGLPPMQR